MLAPNNANDVTFRNLRFDDDAGNLKGSGYGHSLVFLTYASDITFDNVEFTSNTEQLAAFQVTVDFTASKRVTLQDCHFITNGSVVFIGASQLRLDGCVFEGVYDVHTMLHFQGSGEASVTNCQAKDLNFDTKGTDPDGYANGRFIRGEGSFNENIYIGNNQTIDLAPATFHVDTTYANVGEQINFEVQGPLYYGNPLAASTDSVTFDDLATNYLQVAGRLTASIVEGKGLGQRRKVTALNTTTDTIVVDPPWNVIPDSTSIISLSATQQNVVIYDNNLDGKEEWMTDASLIGTTLAPGKHVASSGLTIGGVAHFVVVNNDISDVRQGINMIPSQRDWTGKSGGDARSQFDSDFFNYFADNTIINAVRGVELTASPDMQANGFAAVGYGSAHLGTTIRNNTFAQMKKHYKLTTPEFHSFVIGTELSHQYRAADLTIIEGNEYPQNAGYLEAEGLVGIGMYGVYSPSIFDTVIRNNDFSGMDDKTGAKGVDFGVDGTPALFGNNWGSATEYSGAYGPGQVVELPRRVVRLEWNEATNKLSGDTAIPVRNAGAVYGTLPVGVFWAESDSNWLNVDLDNLPNDETGVEFVSIAIDTDQIQLLGTDDNDQNGVYTATIYVTNGNQVEALTVVVTIVENPDVGPFNGDLPNLRHDRAITIEAEHYDRGGNNVGFYDPNAEDHVVGSIIDDPIASDWYKYTVNVPAPGWYRVQMRGRANDYGGEWILEYGSDVRYFAFTTGNWETALGDGHVYLDYGVQTLKLNVSTEGQADLDWMRFTPADSETKGIPVPYLQTEPVISRAQMTTIQTENYDSGGTLVAYYDSTAGNSFNSIRIDERVDIDPFANEAYAVRGVANEYVRYTINVAQPGTYHVQFKVANTDGGGQIRFQTAGAVSLFNDGLGDDVNIPDSDSFTEWVYLTRTVEFKSSGEQTVQIKFQTNATSGEKVAAQIDRIHIWQGGFVGPEQFPQTEPVAAGSFKQVGTAFALNAPGTIDSLRFYLNSKETGSHTLRFWKINESQIVGGAVVFTDAEELASASTSATSAGWKEVPISPVSVDPGLYVVSVNVNSHYSITTITSAAPAATPSLLTIVAGSFTTSPGSGALPQVVYSDTASGYPNAYFWLDVKFTPSTAN